MKILMMDFLHWVFPKNNNSFIELLQENNIEFKYIVPKTVHRNSRVIEVPHNHKSPDPYYQGFNIHNMIKVEMIKETGWYKWKQKIQDKYVLRMMGLIDWLYKIYEDEKPTHILVEGGLTYFARACSEVARELGIQIITTENSFIKDKIFLDFHTGFICNRHEFARSSQDWMDTRYLTLARRKEVDKIIADVFQNLKFASKTVQALPKLNHEKTLLVPLQVTGDQVIAYDTKYNNEKFINEIIWLANNKFQDWNIILRCHPVEERWKHLAFTGNWASKQKLPKNVILIRGAFDSINTQELMKMSDLIMVNTSQSGLEACLLEKPVIVFGDTFYHNKGFTVNYKRTLNWEHIKENPTDIVKPNIMKLWFYYFYKWLYNKSFDQSDKNRILQNLGKRV